MGGRLRRRIHSLTYRSFRLHEYHGVEVDSEIRICKSLKRGEMKFGFS
jgi:hypothetical protein